MPDIMKRPTELIITYTDPLEGFKGYLAIDALSHKVAAGGMRVQKGLNAEKLSNMAKNMTLKQRIGGMCVDGAKCGIDYDPASPGKHEAMRRFFIALRPYMHERYSMGPDMNTTLPEIDEILRSIGIPSAKMAVANAQGYTLDEFMERYALMGEKVDGFTLGKRRSGHGVAMAALAAIKRLGIDPKDARVAIQGFGGLGAGAAYSLYREGVKIIAVADQEKCLYCKDDSGLNIEDLMNKTTGTLLPADGSHCWAYDCSDRIFEIPCDVMIPAAVENVIDLKRAADMNVRAVVEGANLPATPEAEEVLHRRGILVVPDFVGGGAGSISVDGIFGPSAKASAQDVLNHIRRRLFAIVDEVFTRSKRDNCTPRQAALAICSEVVPAPDEKPYGHYVEV